MAVVRPFAAIRYSAAEGADISTLAAPPYDVVSDDERERLLAADPHNVVALELAEGPLDPQVPGSRYETAAQRWREWLVSDVLVTDASPAMYVLEQRYTHGGHTLSRRGFVAGVDLEPFDAGIVLPHERTLPKAIDDRLNITRATRANLSQVFGMFSDPKGVTRPVLESAMSLDPLVTATDADGVASVVWALRDADAIATLTGHLAGERVFIADGHHRYTTALRYRDERRAGGPPSDSVPPAYDSVMMALVDMDDPGLVVWPTHRIADAPGPFDADAFWRRLSERFDLTELTAGHGADALTGLGDRPGFIVRTRDGSMRLAALRGGMDHAGAFPPDASAAWRSLDVAVLQELVLSPLLDIHPDRAATLDRISFSKDAHKALEAAADHDAVFVLRPTRMDQVAAVAVAGETMPQKSTYFHPKLLSGLLFKSLD